MLHGAARFGSSRRTCLLAAQVLLSPSFQTTTQTCCKLSVPHYYFRIISRSCVCPPCHTAAPIIGHLSVDFIFDYQTLHLRTRVGQLNVLAHLVNSFVASAVLMWIVSQAAWLPGVCIVPAPSAARCSRAQWHMRHHDCMADITASTACICLVVSSCHPAPLCHFLWVRLPILLLQVERAKKCLDFASTCYIWHFIFSWAAFGLPKSLVW